MQENVLTIIYHLKYCMHTYIPYYLCTYFYRLQTALHKAAWYGYRTICHTLVEAGASLTRQDYQGNTPYDKAKQNGDKELARYLKGEIFTVP